MFGKHLEPAEATVLFVELSSSHHIYEFILDVRTASGKVFRVDKKQEFIPFTHPEVGDVVKVKYNPKNMKVEFDLKGDIRYDARAREAAARARRDAILSSQPGTPLPPDPLTATFQDRFQSTSDAGTALNLDLNEIMNKAFSGNTFPSGATVIHVESNGQTFTSNGTSAQGQAGPAQMAFVQSTLLRVELQSRGATGTATILYVEDAGMSFPPFTAQKITARVQESSSYQVFDSTFTAWVDTRKVQLTPGTSIAVCYDPANHDKIILCQ